MILPILLSLFVAIPSVFSEPAGGVKARPIYLKATDTEALKAKDGQKVTVYGTTKNSGKSDSGTNFVNFEGAEFYLITFKSDLVAFKDGEPADLYEGKRLAVTGVVSIYKEKPQFKVTDPDQVKVLAADEEFPPGDAPAAAPKSTGAKNSARKDPGAEGKKATAEKPKKKPPVDPKRFFK